MPAYASDGFGLHHGGGAEPTADDAMERGATRARPVEGERTCGCGEEAGRSGRYSEIERREAIARERADQQVVCSPGANARRR